MKKTKTSIALVSLLMSSYISTSAVPSQASTISPLKQPSTITLMESSVADSPTEGTTESSAETDARAAWTTMVVNKIVSGDYEGALKDCSDAINKDDKDSAAFYLRAIVKYYLLEPLPVVIQDLDGAIARNAEFVDALLLRGIFLMRMNDYKTAVKDLDKVVAMQPDNVNAIAQRLEAHQVLKDYSGLVDDYTLLVALYPENAGVYYQRALAKEKLNDKDGALADLRKAEELVVAQKDEEGTKVVREKIASLEKGSTSTS